MWEDATSLFYKVTLTTIVSKFLWLAALTSITYIETVKEKNTLLSHVCLYSEFRWLFLLETYLVLNKKNKKKIHLHAG